jgi:hypothetical protein
VDCETQTCATYSGGHGAGQDGHGFKQDGHVTQKKALVFVHWLGRERLLVVFLGTSELLNIP